MNLLPIRYARLVPVRLDVPVPETPYTGPGDVVTSALGWWGLRAYSSSARGSNCCRIVRASDSAEQDFVTTSSGQLDRAAIQSFLTATTGKFVTFYDQSGAGRNLTQATDANRAAVNLSGIGSLVTADFTAASSHRYSTAGSLSQSQPLTFSAAAKSTNNGVQQSLLVDAGNVQLGYRNSADNQAFLFAGTAITATASDGNFHSLQGVANGVSSDINVDGAAAVANASTSAISGTTSLGHVGGSQHFNGQWLEAGIWAGAFTGTQSTNMDTNQSAFWGY